MDKQTKIIIGLLPVVLILSIIIALKLTGASNSRGKEMILNQQVNYEEKGEDKANDSSIGTLYNISDKISCRNNVFEYTNLYIDEYDEDFESRIIYTDTIKNITSASQKPNIRIKFYDSNKELILDYQHVRINPDIDSTRNIEPGENLSISSTVYDGKAHLLDFDRALNNGKSLKEAKYFSIEEIEDIE